ncbi:MAG TPA: cation:proton antiporter [Acidobacteriota bacterium]|nr:cation:proton antiporter [Acidobacteriota bacterium]HNB74286.1 cation:proton antiporter [Acidobacteriota bacterium]
MVAATQELVHPHERTARKRYGVAIRLGFSFLMFGLMGYLRAQNILTAEHDLGAYALVSLGFILLAAYNFSIVLGSIGVPHVTAYLLIGILSGPYVFNLFSTDVVKELGLVNNLALGLIAFIAGGELRLRILRERWKSISLMMVCEMTCVFLVCGLGMLAIAQFLPFFGKVSGQFPSLSLALAFIGCILVSSPAVTISMMNEYRPTGPVSQTTLGIVVLKDIVVVLIFGLTLALTKMLSLSDAQVSITGLAIHFVKELGLSVLFGLVAGLIVSIYLKYIRTNLVFFTVGLSLFAFHVAKMLHLDPVLLCLVAGFFVENFTRQGERFLENLEHTFSVVFVIFFTVAGAKLNLTALATVWPIAILFVILRMVSLYAGTQLGAKLSNASPEVARLTWLGLIPQAGVALGLVIIVEQAFPGWGADLATIIVAMIGIHETLGPLAFRLALSMSGEMNREQITHDQKMLQEWDASTSPEMNPNAIW